MAKKGNGGMGVILALGLGVGAFAMFRQGQASANTLTSATLKGFELKSLSGTSLAAVANVEFSNTEVNRDTALQALGMNVLYNNTVISTVHLTEPQTLPANQNVTVGVPMTLNLGALFTQLALSGKIPPLSSFKSFTGLRTWLQDKIAPESLQLQGTAKVDGVTVQFNNPLNLADYLPTAPRSGPVEQLPTRTAKPVVRAPSTSRPAPVAQQLPTRTTSPVVQRPTTRAATPPAKSTSRVKQAAQAVKKSGPVLQQAASIVRTAASAVKSIKQARPAAGAKPTAGKVRQAGKPPTKARRPRHDDGLPKLNLPVVKP